MTKKSFYSNDGAFEFVVSTKVLDFWTETLAASILMVGLKKTGCSGYSYTFELSDSVPSEEKFYILNLGQGTSLAVEKTIAQNVFQVLFCEEIQEQGGFSLKWTHQAAKFFCGCGESFAIEN